MPAKYKKKGFILPVVLLLGFITYAVFSPIPVSMITRLCFTWDGSVAPDNYEDIKAQVEVFGDLVYTSEYEENLADIYIPKNKEDGPAPVILWVHGGGFVGGGKKDAEKYATALASEGVAVICIDYGRAPEAKHPVPLIQTDEAYLWLKSVAGEYNIDMDRLVLAGDSAGAHIAAQFAAIQSNADYAEGLGFEQNVPLHTLKGTLLFCGPYDVAMLGDYDNFAVDFVLGQIAWAYLGEKNMVEQFAYELTIPNHITSDFPPTFITDGNFLSFEEHGMELAYILGENGVLVEKYFIPREVKRARHEYQFIMNTDIGKESFSKVVNFLKDQA